PKKSKKHDTDDGRYDDDKEEEKEEPKKSAAAIAKEKAERDYDEYGPWSVKIPSQYRGKGYALRIDDKVAPLKGDTVKLHGEDFRQRVEMVDHEGRMLSDDTVYVDPYIFDYAHGR